MTIGNPPQVLRALIDINWKSLFVPSVECQHSPDSSSLCRDYVRNFFNGTASSTHRSFGAAKLVGYDGALFKGLKASDTVRIGPHNLANQYFLEATSVTPNDFVSFYFNYDSVLGLAPEQIARDRGSSTFSKSPEHRSPFQSLISEGRLERPRFSILLPKPPRLPTQTRTGGYLLLGEDDPIYFKSKFLSIPIDSDSVDKGLWKSAVTSYSFNSSIPILFPAGSIISFDTTLPFIHVSEQLARTIKNGLPAEIIPCDQRSALPVLKFTISSITLELDGYDYMIEWYKNGEIKEQYCRLAVIGRSQGPKDIMLESIFFQKYYSVFDLESLAINITPRLEDANIT
ncbi:acid protease [Microthyrium microscopicum]|uniref:Acid protease n=1 Tax=Microthyrium microscopicum TaxID=703497 RepID=A0A6A6UPU7_9PEZI|nr:acid protease [Microthyrium microscopicum]